LLGALPAASQPLLSDRLSAEEVHAASEAMREIWKSESLPELTEGGTSHGLIQLRYARFNTSFVKKTDRVETSQLIQCSHLRNGWKCSEPSTQLRIHAGMTHVFHEPKAVALDTVVAIADYVNSACFGTQLKQMSGTDLSPFVSRGIADIDRLQDEYSVR